MNVTLRENRHLRYLKIWKESHYIGNGKVTFTRPYWILGKLADLSMMNMDMSWKGIVKVV